MQERPVFTLPGVPMFLLLLASMALSVWWLIQTVNMYAMTRRKRSSTSTTS